MYLFTYYIYQFNPTHRTYFYCVSFSNLIGSVSLSVASSKHWYFLASFIFIIYANTKLLFLKYFFSEKHSNSYYFQTKYWTFSFWLCSNWRFYQKCLQNYVGCSINSNSFIHFSFLNRIRFITNTNQIFVWCFCSYYWGLFPNFSNSFRFRKC